MWCSSIACRYRAGVALGASLEISFLFANSVMVPNCPNRRHLGDYGGGVGPRGVRQGVGGMVLDVIVLERCVSDDVFPVRFG